MDKVLEEMQRKKGIRVGLPQVVIEKLTTDDIEKLTRKTSLSSVSKNIIECLPTNLEIKKSLIDGAGLGVFAIGKISSDTVYGPYTGTRIDVGSFLEEGDSSYMWEISRNEQVLGYINGKDERSSNWLRYVNCARSSYEQNILAFQDKESVYYTVYKDIEVGDELLVWYGESFAEELGISCDDVDVGTSTKPSGSEYICDVCNMSFCEMEYLKSHLTYCKWKLRSQFISTNDDLSIPEFNEKMSKIVAEREQSNSRFHCSECDKSFTDKRNLRQHIAIHRGVKEFTCDICGKSYRQSSTLREHVASVHLKLRPYACTFCTYRCFKKHGLRKHLRVHTGEKPYQCSFCDSKFSFASCLSRHVQIHTGMKPFKCDFCEKEFSRKHIKTHHESRVHANEIKIATDVKSEREE